MIHFAHVCRRNPYRERIAKLVTTDINSHPATADETAIAPTLTGLTVFILGIATRRRKNTTTANRSIAIVRASISDLDEN